MKFNSQELHASLRGPHLAELFRARFELLNWHSSRTGRRLLLRWAKSVDGMLQVVHSIIELVELPAMAPFHLALRRLVGRELRMPPVHVTLYTTPAQGGIVVARPSQLRGYRSREVTAAKLGKSDPRI